MGRSASQRGTGTRSLVELQMRHMGMFECDNAQAKPALSITGFRAWWLNDA